MLSTINNEWIYDQSPKEVWAYLTQSDLIALWLMPNNFQPILGHAFQFTNKPIPSLELDGIFPCEVLELVPYKRLVYSWKGGPGNGVFTLDTVVEWTLEPLESGTRLMLKQTGFTNSNFSIFTGMTEGWDKNIHKMITHLNENQNANAKS